MRRGGRVRERLARYGGPPALGVAAVPGDPAVGVAAVPAAPTRGGPRPARALDVDRPGDPLAPEALDRLTHRTPYLMLDLDRVERAYLGLLDRLDVDAIHYAVKCNPDPRVLATLDRLGCRFQVTSQAELLGLVALGVAPAEVLCSNPVKPVDHIRWAYRAGCWRFAADSVTEVDKLALHAPGSAVYVRLRAAGAGRLGVDPATGVDLLCTAARRGLRPYGVTFHVGSQATDPGVWGTAIAGAGAVMTELERAGIRLRMLDVGGGFPARYEGVDPDLGGHGAAIAAAVARLPYRPRLVAEPGRALVAEAGVLVGTVVGTAVRDGRTWVHLDVGAFNGVMEALATGAARAFPVSDSRRGRPLSCHLAGPTCDSRDTLRLDVPLSAGLTVGDRVYLGTAGAYTTAQVSGFNGVDLPHTWCVSSRLDGDAVPAAR